MKWEERVGGHMCLELAGGAFALWVFPDWQTPLVDKARWTFEDGRSIVASRSADDFDAAKSESVKTAKRVLTFLADHRTQPERLRVIDQALKDLEALQ